MATKLTADLTAPELLAPAGDWDCAGGGRQWGGRDLLRSRYRLQCASSSHEFFAGQSAELMEFLHRHGVYGYVTMNILAFSDELESLESTRAADRRGGCRCGAGPGSGPGAADPPGRSRSVHSRLDADDADQRRVHWRGRSDWASSASCWLRELSVREIAKIHRQTSMPLEVFVHGALCVAYSGQCLTSESLGGRSANRGQCAQACRLPYELVCDGRDVDLGDQEVLAQPAGPGCLCACTRVD